MNENSASEQDMDWEDQGESNTHVEEEDEEAPQDAETQSLTVKEQFKKDMLQVQNNFSFRERLLHKLHPGDVDAFILDASDLPPDLFSSFENRAEVKVDLGTVIRSGKLFPKLISNLSSNYYKNIKNRPASDAKSRSKGQNCSCTMRAPS